MKEIEKIIKKEGSEYWFNPELWLVNPKQLAQAIKSYIIEIVGEEKRVLELGLDIKTENEYVRHKERVEGHNQLRTTILKRLEGKT